MKESTRRPPAQGCRPVVGSVLKKKISNDARRFCATPPIPAPLRNQSPSRASRPQDAKDGKGRLICDGIGTLAEARQRSSFYGCLGRLGMFPLILTALSRDSNRGPRIPTKDC